jgi:ELWxxDGT repeat protein
VLRVTDGTPAGSRQIHDLEVYTHDFDGIWTVFQDRLYYVAWDFQAFGFAVWVTDGTAAGTRPLLDRDGRFVEPVWLAVLGGRLLMGAPNESGRLVLWQSDGTQAGTFQIQTPVFPGFGAARAGDRVFFSGYDPATGWELWAVRP